LALPQVPRYSTRTRHASERHTMPSYHARALVLRKTKLGETDSILNLLAEDGRQIRAVAKGVRKPGSRFGGRLEPHSVVDLLLHTGRNLDVITEADTVVTHSAVREDFDRASAAAVVADVLDKMSLEGQAEDRLFGLGDATLAALEVADVSRLPQIVSAFLVKAMAMHGYRPQLESCAACAASAEGGSGFSLAAGGIVCPDCGSGEAVVRFSEDGRSQLERMLSSTMAEVASAHEDSETVRQTLDLLRGFVAYHVPAKMKALDMYAMRAG